MSQRSLLVVLVGYLGLLAVVLLAPTSTTQSEGAAWLGDLGIALGLPERVLTPPRVEFVANVLIVVPVSALGALIWPRTTWRDWTAYALVAATAVEAVQGLLLPARTASSADIVANTLGGLAGAVVVALARQVRRRRTVRSR